METKLASSLDAVKADRGQIEQVILNLVVNARDAMPDGGRLSIETANVYLREGVTSTYLTAPPANYVMLAVSDTGSGMTPRGTRASLRAVLYDQRHGQGDGPRAGDRLRHRQAEQRRHHGRERCRRRQRVQRSISRDCSEHAAARRNRIIGEGREERPANGKATILIVEDDPGIRELSSKILRALRVQGADRRRRRRGARDRASSTTAAFIVLLSDVVMPGMNGPMVAEMLKKMRPAIKVLFMSGYTDDASCGRA